MTMRLKEKELVGLGISLAAGCRPCTDYHLKAVREAKASEEEMRRVIEVALGVRQHAVAVMRAYSLGQLGDTIEVAGPDTGGADRVTVLASIGAAFAVNCTASLERHLAAVGPAGISQDEVEAVARLARFIRGKAASHVDKLVPMAEAA